MLLDMQTVVDYRLSSAWTVYNTTHSTFYLPKAAAKSRLFDLIDKNDYICKTNIMFIWSAYLSGGVIIGKNTIWLKVQHCSETSCFYLCSVCFTLQTLCLLTILSS